MARIMAIDYGEKRTGLAVTDPLQMIASALETIATERLIPFLKQYLVTEAVELFIVGWPLNMDGSATHATSGAEKCIRDLQKHFPHIPVVKVDERLTSRMAQQALVQMGLKKKQRRDKKLVDRVAAAMMLQEYLETRRI
ncbi:MAG: Holliday junction resolvase RuvX [Chitinophagaceae bacterium]|nr:Holliday junction resolvase RuvX [Chitinophagaceae bacterium]